MDAFMMIEKSAFPPSGTLTECFNKSTPYVYGFNLAIKPKIPGRLFTG